MQVVYIFIIKRAEAVKETDRRCDPVDQQGDPEPVSVVYDQGARGDETESGGLRMVRIPDSLGQGRSIQHHVCVLCGWLYDAGYFRLWDGGCARDRRVDGDPQIIGGPGDRAVLHESQQADVFP